MNDISPTHDQQLRKSLNSFRGVPKEQSLLDESDEETDLFADDQAPLLRNKQNVAGDDDDDDLLGDDFDPTAEENPLNSSQGSMNQSGSEKDSLEDCIHFRSGKEAYEEEKVVGER